MKLKKALTKTSKTLKKTRNKPIKLIFNLVLKIFPKKLLDFNLPPQKEGLFLIAKKMSEKSSSDFLKMAL